jgi:actin-related protein
MSDAPVLVVDIGSASLKAGYAGEDAPATIIPSVAQKCANGLEVCYLHKISPFLDIYFC